MPNSVSVLRVASDLTGRRLELRRELGGGQHAGTFLAGDQAGDVVVRVFPVGDEAVVQELRVLERVRDLGELAPKYIAHGSVLEHPLIVTSVVRGHAAGRAVSLHRMAEQLGAILARIHQLDGTGLRDNFQWALPGTSKLAGAARAAWEGLDVREQVLTHYDFWSGNTLWHDDTLTGVVDWSGARLAPRGVDIAWCRQDLVLLGSASAADHLLHTYEAHAGVKIDDVVTWDLLAAAHADRAVESWAPNYEGVGRPEITSSVLRRRLSSWVRSLGTA